MLNKKILLATAILACSMSSVAMAEDLEIHGYVKTGVLVDKDLSTVSSSGVDGMFRENNSFNGSTLEVPANQFELTGIKRFTSDNGAQGRLDFRLEYGNGSDGASYLYSSAGGETGGTDNYFELKEAFVTLEKLDFLPEGSSVWAGRKFYGRDSGALSGEFWKQSSGVGFGYETNKFAVALVGADLVKPETNSQTDKFKLDANDDGKVDGTDVVGPIKVNNSTVKDNDDRQTAFVLDTRIKNIKVPGGSVEAQVNLYAQKNAQEETGESDRAETGIGAGLTYNIDGYYGVKGGWSKAAVTVGTGIGAYAKGLNFGSWVGGAKEDSKSIFATTYGVANLSDKLQMGTEVSVLNGKKLYDADKNDLTRFGVSVNPSYKVGKNLRLTAEASLGKEIVKDWKADLTTASLTIAPIISVNNDFYGRPQIKPFVTFVSQDNADGSWTYEHDNKDSAVFAGVVAEVWF